MECNDPFSQYLSLISALFSSKDKVRVLEDDVQTVGRLDEANILDDVVMLESYMSFGLKLNTTIRLT
jgi:hypothetical protein